MIKIAAVRRKTLGSKIIRFGLGEDASHLIVMFPATDSVLHFYGSGFVCEGIEKVLPVYDEVASVFIGAGALECAIARTMIQRLIGTEYDTHGFLYFGMMALRRKVLRLPLPKRNHAQRDERNLCTEILYCFFDVWAEVMGQSAPFAYDLAITTPIDCVKLVKEILKPCVFSPCPWPWEPLSLVPVPPLKSTRL